MNGLDDPSLSREALKGFYMFLVSESARHQEDIDAIGAKLEEVERRIDMTLEEKLALSLEASRYVSF